MERFMEEIIRLADLLCVFRDLGNTVTFAVNDTVADTVSEFRTAEEHLKMLPEETLQRYLTGCDNLKGLKYILVA